MLNQLLRLSHYFSVARKVKQDEIEKSCAVRSCASNCSRMSYRSRSNLDERCGAPASLARVACPLVHLRAGLLDDLAPARDLGADPSTEVLGRAGDHLELDREQLVAHLRRVEDLNDLA